VAWVQQAPAGWLGMHGAAADSEGCGSCTLRPPPADARRVSAMAAGGRCRPLGGPFPAASMTATSGAGGAFATQAQNRTVQPSQVVSTWRPGRPRWPLGASSGPRAAPGVQGERAGARGCARMSGCCACCILPSAGLATTCICHGRASIYIGTHDNDTTLGGAPSSIPRRCGPLTSLCSSRWASMPEILIRAARVPWRTSR
jgi:hypothetical protein